MKTITLSTIKTNERFEIVKNKMNELVGLNEVNLIDTILESNEAFIELVS